MDQSELLSVHARQHLVAGTRGFTISPAFDVALAPGSILVLFGPSGAGKTTILRQIAGLERPDSGTIRFGATCWFDARAGIWVSPQQRHTSVVFQDAALFPHLTVRQNIEYGVTATPERTHGQASRLGIEHLLDRMPPALSGGEAQRVALARALAPAPRLALLDEPFASLDAPTRMRLRRDVRSILHETGTPALLVTHDRGEAMAMGDQLAVVLDGHVRQVGVVANVFSRPVDAAVAAALGIEAVLPARIADVSNGVLTVSVGDARLYVAEREPIAPGTAVYACIRAEDVTIELQSAAHASARNHLPARIASIVPEGPIERVTLDCGFSLDALITRQAREELSLRPGGTVTAAIKATSVHLVPLV